MKEFRTNYYYTVTLDKNLAKNNGAGEYIIHYDGKVETTKFTKFAWGEQERLNLKKIKEKIKDTYGVKSIAGDIKGLGPVDIEFKMAHSQTIEEYAN